MRSRRRYLRDFEAGHYLDVFLVSTICAVLLIRFSLHLTHYPTIGGSSLHIAHVLWGGLLMLVAIVVLLSYLGRGIHGLAAVVGGVGFGAFIDEIGKFVTHDNDYFYKPTPALIYIVLVLLYLAIRSIHRETTATPEEYLVNALQEVEQVAIDDLDAHERDRALYYLDRSDPGDPLVTTVRGLLEQSALAPSSRPGRILRLQARAVDGYRRLTRLRGFATALVVFFVVQLLLKLIHVVALTPFLWSQSSLSALRLGRAANVSDLTVAGWMQLASSLISGGFVALGIWRTRSSHLRALQLFQKSVLVSIFLTQIFMFYQEQWDALIELAINVLLFAALRFMIERAREETWQPRGTRGGAPGTAPVGERSQD